MHIRLAIVVLLMLLLAACNSRNPNLPSDPIENPLFTDADIDAASIHKFKTKSVDAAGEVGSVTGSTEDKSADSGPITAQAILPGASGVIAYIRYTPTATNPYAIILFDQATDIKTVVYSGKREIGSVAVDGLGKKVVFSARQTINVTSDFEIYELVLNPKTVSALTDNDSDDTNVSISADTAIIAWEGLRSTTATRQVQWLETATITLKILNTTANDTMPSVSGNGAYLAFIRTFSTGTIRVQVYQLSNATLTNVYSNTVIKHHPSVTDDKSKVAWTEVGTTTRVYVKDMTTGVRTSVVSSANGIEHAHLRKDGKYLTYGLLVSGKWQLYTRNLTTNTSIKGVGSTLSDAKGMFWAPSFLDTTFGSGGLVVTDFGNNERAKALVIDSNGKLVVAGSIGNSNAVEMGLVRYNSNGSLDTSFGIGGTATKDFGLGYNIGEDVAIDSNGKLILSGWVQTCEGCLYAYGTIRINANGTLDTSFGAGGSVLTKFTPPEVGGSDSAYAVAVDDGGNIVIAGTAQQTTGLGDFNFGLARYDILGNADATFGIPDSVVVGEAGLVTTDFGFYEGLNSVIVSGTKLIATGVTSGNFEGDPYDFAIARYNQDGSLDISFDSDGKVTTDFAGGGDTAYDAIVDSAGRLVVVGAVNPDSMTPFTDFALARYNQDGSLDTSFGTGGKVTTDFREIFDTAYAVAIDSSEKIVAAGVTTDGIAIARYNTNGTLDASFGINGKYVINNLCDCTVEAYDLAIDANGKLVLVGYSSASSTDDIWIARLNP